MTVEELISELIEVEDKQKDVKIITTGLNGGSHEAEVVMELSTSVSIFIY